MPRKPRYTVSTAARTVAAPNSQVHATLHTDGMHDTGANTSSAQGRARAPPALHSGKRDIRDARAPATNTKHPDLHEVVDDHSEDEDYDPEADEVESFDDHVDDLFTAHEVECQGNANSKKRTPIVGLLILFPLLENGVTSCMELTVKEALVLPPGKKIVLNHNKELQQVGHAAGLLSGFLGTLGSDFQQLPICEKS
ncbi:hypothetical protein Ahy_A08g038961 isoform B [Arachis hypogaea]|uniref:Uncharacterized protein n=1 Tax=Arachis hypogaea TaxID=3818 RepID=A0A445BUT8_ARAHY|nr:hypothetical protein Ahy_A08g038961 isoform B [Arachis hypogaea]